MKVVDTPSATPKTPSEVNQKCEAARPSDAPLCASRSGQPWTGKDVSQEAQRKQRHPRRFGATRSLDQDELSYHGDDDIGAGRQARPHGEIVVENDEIEYGTDTGRRQQPVEKGHAVARR